MKKQILDYDKKYLWHPFTQSKSSKDPIIISSAKDEILKDIDGKSYVDLISSWWVNTHGHCKKEIIGSMYQQSKELEHVMFAGFTHEPAVRLAEKLTKLLPQNLKRVFYSDNGSTSVEIAMKVAIQYWYNQGKKKTKFVAFNGGYHGDTFGAMSVGFTSGFYKPFEDILPKANFLPFPDFWHGNNEIEKNETSVLKKIDHMLNKSKKEIAAVIIEPLVQGAGGMRICRKEFLNKVLEKFKSAGVIIIFDEVMTGFGRTGKMFACDHLKIQPDIICLAKSLTGGYIPLATTVFSEKIHSRFVDSDIKKAFLHGHSFTANPIACSAALKSLDLFESKNLKRKIDIISKTHKSCLENLSKRINVSKIRSLGTIAAFDFNGIEKKYGSSAGEKLKKKFLNSGLLLRPIGNTIYLMPPFCISEETLIDCYEKIIEILK